MHRESHVSLAPTCHSINEFISMNYGLLAWISYVTLAEWAHSVCVHESLICVCITHVHMYTLYQLVVSHTHEWAMTHLWNRLIPYVWHDSFISSCVTHFKGMLYINESFHTRMNKPWHTCGISLFLMCDMTHLYVYITHVHMYTLYQLAVSHTHE